MSAVKDKIDIFSEILLSEYSLINHYENLFAELDVYSKEIDQEFKLTLDRKVKELIDLTFENEYLCGVVGFLIKLLPMQNKHRINQREVTYCFLGYIDIKFICLVRVFYNAMLKYS